jgi:hypothetical protein
VKIKSVLIGTPAAGRILAGAILAATVAVPATAGGCRSGMCFTFFVQSTNLRGDLSDPRVLWHFEKAFSIPRPEPGYALGLGLGAKTDKGSWDVSYLRSDHKGAFLDGLPATAVLHVLEINGRSFFIRRSFIHPYFLGGICLPLLRIPHGAKYQGQTYDATYVGGGLNLGVGMSVDIGPSIVLNAGVVGRAAWFLYAYGGGKGRDINHLTEGLGGPKFGRLLRTSSLILAAGLGFIL